jgi:hypothetical protein
MIEGISEKKKRIAEFTTAKAHLMGKILPEINSGMQDLRLIADDAWHALMYANDIQEFVFLHAGRPSRIELSEDERAIIRGLEPAMLKHELARIATWFKVIEGKRSPSKPPNELVADMLATPKPPLPPLLRVTRVPVFAPDGTLELEPGYHPRSQTYYWPRGGLELMKVDPSPSGGAIAVAKYRILKDLLADFPFVHQADLAHTVALFILHYARDLIRGPVPLYAIQAPNPGTGKGLLVDACLGAAIPSLPKTPAPPDDAEWRRTFTAILREGHPVVILDNIKRSLDSGVLAVALTATSWIDRVVRTSETAEIPIRCMWVATGNNMTMSDEIARRTIPIRLDAKTREPWLRDDFKHPNLLQWVDDNRTRLIWAGHTLIQAWIAAGKPEPSCRRLGSYEDWTRVIGGILEYAGIEGFLANRLDFQKAEESENEKWQKLTVAWAASFGINEVRSGDLYPLAAQCGFEFAGATAEARLIAWGKQLAKHEDHIIGDYRIVKSRMVQRAALWRLLPLGPVATA